eukprot:scaffold131879_cov60-Phaeocystis_antarctica.AAC.3
MRPRDAAEKQVTLPLRPPPALAEDLTAPQLAPSLSDLARKQTDEAYESHRERDIMHAVDSTLAAALTIRLYDTLRRFERRLLFT